MNEKNCESDFKLAKENYHKLRLKERKKIVDHFEKLGIAKGKNGASTYNSKGRLDKKYGLNKWLWIELESNSFNFFISLQSFEVDPNSKNLHVLMDRIGIYIYEGEGPVVRDNIKLMTVTNLELPLSPDDLKELENLIMEFKKYKIEEYENGIPKDFNGNVILCKKGKATIY